MLEDCDYDKTKIVHELSSVSWFLKKHAIKDAKKQKHALCAKEYEALQKDLDKHIHALHKAICY